jgi:hypothetical protein
MGHTFGRRIIFGLSFGFSSNQRVHHGTLCGHTILTPTTPSHLSTCGTILYNRLFGYDGRRAFLVVVVVVPQPTTNAGQPSLSDGRWMCVAGRTGTQREWSGKEGKSHIPATAQGIMRMAPILEREENEPPHAAVGCCLGIIGFVRCLSPGYFVHRSSAPFVENASYCSSRKWGKFPLCSRRLKLFPTFAFLIS